MLATLLAAGAVFAGAALADVDTVIAYGSKFFYQTNGTQFFIQGVAYQEPSTSDSSFIDPLANITSCERDIPYLTALRTNTIRVYGVNVNASGTHDDCVNAFADAGMYILIDLGSPTDSIDRDNPTWEVALYERYTAVIDDFANYTNVIGFFAGNEVSNSANTTEASAYVKAAVRDSKAYIAAQGYNKSVGYAAADVPAIRYQLAYYMSCNSADQSVDFFGDNVYEWCGDSSFNISGYNDIAENFANYSVPYFFAEYGCNTVSPRTFTNIPVMYGPEMDYMLNGGIVYEYFNDVNDYGLVTLASDSSVVTLTDYSAFSTEVVSATPTSTARSDYVITNTALQACPTIDANWQAATVLPPTPNASLCACMVAALTCVVDDSVSSADYADLFNYLYGLGDSTYTVGIESNGTSGVYGAYSMCNPQDQLSWALNAYYQAQVAAGKGSGACAFSGSASTQAATTSGSACSSMLAAVGTAGTGSASGSVATASTGSSSTKSGAGSHIVTPVAVFVSSWQVSACIAVAVLSGAALLVL